ncbi:MAG TPA: hypothetical protein VMF61_11005 [Candidatus Acidoferrales bacterium]|nr:hypothetical protein [Candidatus Acidoferrales bacterium]
MSTVRERQWRPAPPPPPPDFPPVVVEPAPLQWVKSIGVTEEHPIDAELRVDMIERLGLLGEPWCEDALRAASHEERDPHVSEAIAAALRKM